jgi:hypothetical protein
VRHCHANRSPTLPSSVPSLGHVHASPSAPQRRSRTDGLLRRSWRTLTRDLDSEAISSRSAAADCTFLAGATVLSLVPYIRGLGFYLDDYSFLGVMSTSKDQSLPGLFDAISSQKQDFRPVQELIISGLYWMFGNHPLPYHLVNAFVIVAMVVLFYLVLRELQLPRLLVVSVPLVYALLPHYATDRFWYSAFQAPLSMALYFLSVLAVLRSVGAGKSRIPLWLALSVVALVGSALAYEVALPLFVVTPFLVWYRARQLHADLSRRTGVAVTIGVYVVALVAIVAWKAVAAHRLGNVSSYHLGYEGGVAHYAAYLVSGIVKLNFGTYGIGLPYVVGWIFVHRFTWAALAVGVLLGLATFSYLGRAGSVRSLPRPATARLLFFAGLLFFVLGYATFLTNSKILFRSAGIDNRVGIAAAAGISMAVVGGVAWLAGVLAGRLRLMVFRTAIAVAAATGAFIVDTLGDYWTTAWHRQQAIVANLERELPPDPSGTRLILNGSCAEVGPGVVFATTTDLSGRLTMEYRNSNIEAVVDRDQLRFGRDHATVVNKFLGHVSTDLDFSYGPKLFVYDAGKRRLYPLRAAEDAHRYEGDAPSDPRCPPLRSFAWGLNVARWLPFV